MSQEEAMRELKPQLQAVDGSRIRKVEKYEQPEPSSVWLASAIGFLSCAATALIASLTLSPDAPVRTSELLIGAVGLTALKVLCLLAHWDTNRGRRPKRYLVREKSEDE
jgi:hypothetical protein